MSSGSLSNRVMNMKFMKKAEDTKISKQRQEEQQKVHDLSEWILPNLDKLLRLAALKPKIETVGYGSIMSSSNYNYASTTRRTWGDINKTRLEVEEIKEETPQEDDEPPLDLNTMWKKRKLESSSKSNKKKRVK
ncbi:hypothetical protein Cantr_08858 [Candida viswanathii]|uniref:M-phase phosphoprotein 6 n=1 Tax=Candida viswanathii TaxID=5486 RepID=A0A367Y9N4_9ASCO|nr:hypothetical protein Cantr_08858 [Candida viswanathii]